MVIPANNTDVTERHLKYLLKLRRNLEADIVQVASQCPYAKEAEQIIKDSGIEKISLDTNQDNTDDSLSTQLQSEEDGITSQIEDHLTSRRAVLAGGGLLGLVGLATVSDNIVGAISSVMDFATGGTISDVTRTTSERGHRQFAVELSDGSLITNVALRDSSGEVVQRADAAPGETQATIQAWGKGTTLEAGEYEIIVTDEGEVVDTEPIEVSTGDIEITDITMVAPAEESNRGFTPLYTNFEVEISGSEGDIPVQLLGGALMDGVPNPKSDPELSGPFDGTAYIQPGETDSFRFSYGDSHTGSYPVAVSTYGSEPFDCGGGPEVASGVLEFSEPESEDTERKELEIEYVTDGEFTRGGHNGNQEACTEGNVVDWSVISSHD